MANSTTVDSAALQGSELTGLPVAFVKSLIQEEGTIQSTNNPFDITQTWANLTGFGNFVTGLWNSIGVGIFSSPQPAIQSWAKGLMTFSNYTKLRADMALPNVTAYQLASDLEKAGYAGGDGSYALKIANLYKENSGESAFSPINTKIAPPSQTNPPANPPTNPPTNQTPTVGLSFGSGIVHLLIAAVLVVIALVSIVVGIKILMPSVMTGNASSIVDAMEVAE